MIGAPFAPFSNAKSPNLLSFGSTWRKNAPAMFFCPDASIETANFFESFTIACDPESFLIPTTTSGGLKLACVTQLTVAAVAVPPCAAPSTKSPYGIIKSACFFAFSSMIRNSLFKKMTSPHYAAREIYSRRDCTDAASQVKESENQGAARSRPLCGRRPMDRRPRQHLSAGQFAPRMPVRGVWRQCRRRSAGSERAPAAIVAAGRRRSLYRLGRRPRDDLHDGAT